MRNCYIQGKSKLLFPKDSNLKELWLKSLNLNAENVKKSSTVCERHFQVEDFQFALVNELFPHGSKKRLVKGAVPTYNNEDNSCTLFDVIAR